MNKEVHYEGWLIKSPPSKRIWRSRWRRRWFTLKQGEIPEQFCLEYYTNRNCRKLKGIIDLDQCEQVDCGLRLENRKQKFQFMFDVKTPKRTYYLAADSAEDMRDWVNCICQVCHLHDTKQSMEDSGVNSGATSPLSKPGAKKEQLKANYHNNEVNDGNKLLVLPSTATVYSDSVYENNDSTYVNAKYRSSELAYDLSSKSSNTKTHKDTNKDADQKCNNFKCENSGAEIYINTSVFCSLTKKNQRPEDYVSRRLPENLILLSSPFLKAYSPGIQPRPVLSNSCGPYIPISECFSGPPKHLETPTTPLNNLDPKFYDTPRSHVNIGLNLTSDQSYSPKITNYATEQIIEATNSSRINNRSDSDSESVFTDDDEWIYPMPLRDIVDRATRPSDSSVENESFVLTYSQRFSKLPDDVNEKFNGCKLKKKYKAKNPPCKMVKMQKKQRNLTLDIKESPKASQGSQLSDTENTSPTIGPRNSNSVVEESYDIPRSHQLPYHNLDNIFKEQMWNPKINNASTVLSLYGAGASKGGSEVTFHNHFYTNAAPNKLEGNVFRYDFSEQTDLPPVNRKLKPKANTAGKLFDELTDITLENAANNDNLALKPPSIDRNLKPDVYKLMNSSLMQHPSRRAADEPTLCQIYSHSNNHYLETQSIPRSIPLPTGKRKIESNAAHTEISNLHQRSESVNHTPVNLKPLPANKKEETRLQYFDLDIANPPAVNRPSISTCNLTKQDAKKLDCLAEATLKGGVVYNSVDFVKTEAFKRICEERKKENGNVNPDLKTSK